LNRSNYFSTDFSTDLIKALEVLYLDGLK